MMFGTVFTKDGMRRTGKILASSLGGFLIVEDRKKKEEKIEIPRENISYIEYKD